MADTDVLVVGAGLAGLVAARQLREAGLRTLLVDKGRSVGGRLATRRMGGARLDHGAQFFTVRGEPFGDIVRHGIAAGVVHEWCRGFDDPADGYPRYAATAGMNSLAKWLAEGLDVEVDCALVSVAESEGGWVAHTKGGASIQARAAVLTPPVPQTLALLDSGGVTLDATTDKTLRGVRYFATLAVLATLDQPPDVPEPGGVQLPQGEPFPFVADNQRKGISERPAITLHANHSYSDERYDDDPVEVLAELLLRAKPWLGPATVVEAQLKKWRYAGPVEVVPSPTVVIDGDGGPAAFAGDAFGGPKVEGAFNSGLAAGRAVVERLR